jgi:hypothetical protein
MNSMLSKINIDTNKIITFAHLTPTRSFLFGAGLYYSISIEKYWQVPLVFLFPSAYAGYHTFKNREEVKKFIFS